MAVLFLILKVILFLILGLLALAVAAAAAVLFVPVSYRLRAESNGSFSVKLDAGWMFGALRFLYQTRGSAGGNSAVVKVLGIPLKRRGAGKNRAGAPEAGNETASGAGSETASGAGSKKDESAAGEKKANKRSKKIENAKDVKERRKREKFAGADGKIRQILNIPDKKRLFALAGKLLKRLARPLKKQKFSANGVIGFDDPSHTGYVLGLAGALCGIFGLCGIINLRGDFERQVLIYKINARGRLYFISFVWPAAAFIFARPVWAVVRPAILKRK